MAQAINAGIPHLVVPHGHDQPDNALRIERLGLGIGTYPERYKAARVARELKRLLDTSDVRARCTQFAGKIDTNRALQVACDMIEALSKNAEVRERQAIA